MCVSTAFVSDLKEEIIYFTSLAFIVLRSFNSAFTYDFVKGLNKTDTRQDYN